jgi:hypothetical protein
MIDGNRGGRHHDRRRLNDHRLLDQDRLRDDDGLLHDDWLLNHDRLGNGNGPAAAATTTAAAAAERRSAVKRCRRVTKSTATASGGSGVAEHGSEQSDAGYQKTSIKRHDTPLQNGPNHEADDDDRCVRDAITCVRTVPAMSAAADLAADLEADLAEAALRHWAADPAAVAH